MRERQKLNPSKPPKGCVVRPVRQKGTNRLRDGKEEKEGIRVCQPHQTRVKKGDEKRGGVREMEKVEEIEADKNLLSLCLHQNLSLISSSGEE